MLRETLSSACSHVLQPEFIHGPLLPALYVFLQFGQRFQPYVQYCLRVKQTMAYAREQQDTNPLFHTFVQVSCGAQGLWAGAGGGLN